MKSSYLTNTDNFDFVLLFNKVKLAMLNLINFLVSL